MSDPELGDFDGAFLAATMMELKPGITDNHRDSWNHPPGANFLKEFQEITHQ